MNCKKNLQSGSAYSALSDSRTCRSSASVAVRRWRHSLISSPALFVNETIESMSQLSDWSSRRILSSSATASLYEKFLSPPFSADAMGCWSIMIFYLWVEIISDFTKPFLRRVVSTIPGVRADTSVTAFPSGPVVSENPRASTASGDSTLIISS